MKKDHHCLPDKVKPLTVSIPLRSCDVVIDLTIDGVSPSVNCTVSQPPLIVLHHYHPLTVLCTS